MDAAEYVIVALNVILALGCGWRSALMLAVYSSLPAASFLSVPVVTAVVGWSILSGDAGARFGIPSFVPWPLNTILGFCLAVTAVGVVAKVVVTTALALMVIHSDHRQAAAGT